MESDEEAFMDSVAHAVGGGTSVGLAAIGLEFTSAD